MSLLVIVPQTVTELCPYMPAAPVLHTFGQYLGLIAFYSRQKTASHVVSGRFVRLAEPDKCKFHDLRLNRSPDIRREAVGGGIIDRFFELP